MGARQLWELLIMSTYNRNEPGVLFYDTINNYNPVSYCQRIVTTNPCGEIPQPSNVCNLGNINLVKFFNEKTGEFSYQEFKQIVKIAVRFLDNVCDISYVPITQYQEQIRNMRRVGVGVLGLGSLLYMMKIRFGSARAIQFVQNLFKIKCETQLLQSALIGKEKGSFLKFDKNKYFNTKY